MKLPKLPKIEFSKMERSRLKITFIFGGAAFLLCLFPMYIIYVASGHNVFDITAPWIALGTLVTAFTGVAGYYVSRETHRPSLLSNTFIGDVTGGLTPDPNDIGETDPENIPL
jgi:hypothetical protein